MRGKGQLFRAFLNACRTGLNPLLKKSETDTAVPAADLLCLKDDETSRQKLHEAAMSVEIPTVETALAQRGFDTAQLLAGHDLPIIDQNNPEQAEQIIYAIFLNLDLEGLDPYTETKNMVQHILSKNRGPFAAIRNNPDYPVASYFPGLIVKSGPEEDPVEWLREMSSLDFPFNDPQIAQNDIFALGVLHEAAHLLPDEQIPAITVKGSDEQDVESSDKYSYAYIVQAEARSDAFAFEQGKKIGISNEAIELQHAARYASHVATYAFQGEEDPHNNAVVLTRYFNGEDLPTAAQLHTTNDEMAAFWAEENRKAQIHAEQNEYEHSSLNLQRFVNALNQPETIQPLSADVKTIFDNMRGFMNESCPLIMSAGAAQNHSVSSVYSSEM